jgi:ubiquinone/menaquinone biosynthesis C-methylase UbiE
MGGVEFYTYDTKTLPFKSKQFDLIISQQVIEHVGNIEQYIDECYRVLSKDGSVLLEFPHRMVPFDTHTRMWFVHYFPEFVKKYFYNKYREGRYTYFSKSLFLRMPSLYSLLFNKIFNKVEDLTIDRVGNFRYKDHYEGNKKIREAVDKIIHIPLVGYPLLRVLTLFVNKTIVLHK